MKKIRNLLFILPIFFFSASIFGQVTIFSEGFDYPPDDLPSTWVIDADEPSEWSINESQIAGGVFPELYMGYGFQVGLSRLISPAIPIGTQKELAIRYKQYLINYQMDWGETLGMDVTFDGGASWQVVWESPLGFWNIPQDEFVYFVTAPETATEMQIAFRFEGNNLGINGWAIDDIVVEEVVENDLLASNISGNTAPNSNQETSFTVEITNGGQLTQSDYEVILKDGEDQILTSATGEPINYGERKNIVLNWTPTTSDFGEHTIYAVVESTLDENIGNNQTWELTINVQTEIAEQVQLGNGSSVIQHSIPFNFYVLDNLSQSLYLSDNIGVTNEPISGIMYTGQFDEDVEDVPIQIYLAQTNQTDLETEWLTPYAFTLVFDGLVDFKKGFNSFYIPFDTAYEYGGGNLVVYTNKSYSEQVLWSTFVGSSTDDIVRSRNADGYDGPMDAMNPPSGYPVFASPDITLFFESGELSVIGNNQDLANLVVYPNPVEDLLHIQIGNNQNISQVQLINSLGQIVLNEKGNTLDNYDLNVESLKSGFYVLQINTTAGSISKKIIIH